MSVSLDGNPWRIFSKPPFFSVRSFLTFSLCGTSLCFVDFKSPIRASRRLVIFFTNSSVDKELRSSFFIFLVFLKRKVLQFIYMDVDELIADLRYENDYLKLQLKTLKNDVRIYQYEIQKLFNENLQLTSKISQLLAQKFENKSLRTEMEGWKFLAMQAEENNGGDTDTE